MISICSIHLRMKFRLDLYRLRARTLLSNHRKSPVVTEVSSDAVVQGSTCGGESVENKMDVDVPQGKTTWVAPENCRYVIH